MAQVGVLLVDPDQTLVGGIRQALEGHPYELRLGGPSHALETIGTGDVEAVLVSLGRGEEARRPHRRHLRPVARSPDRGRDRARRADPGVQARAAGAWDYLDASSDLAPERLLTVLANALDRRRLRRELPAAQAAAPETLNLEARERQAILAALEATRWNKQAAARLLGLHRPTLYAKMRKHGVPQTRPH